MSREYVVSILLGATLAGCVVIDDPDIDSIDIDGVTAFAYVAEPPHSMDALNTGPVQVRDGCLAVAGLVAVWRPSQLDTVRTVVEQLEDGQEPRMRLGGGAFGRTDDLPDGMGEGCRGLPLWSVGDLAEIVDDTGVP